MIAGRETMPSPHDRKGAARAGLASASCSLPGAILTEEARRVRVLRIDPRMGPSAMVDG